jgi:hypothetical protein
VLRQFVCHLGVDVDAPAYGKTAMLPLILADLGPRCYAMKIDNMDNIKYIINELVALGASLTTPLVTEQQPPQTTQPDDGKSHHQTQSTHTYASGLSLMTVLAAASGTQTMSAATCRCALVCVIRASLLRRGSVQEIVDEVLDDAILFDLRQIVMAYYDWSSDDHAVFAAQAGFDLPT